VREDPNTDQAGNSAQENAGSDENRPIH
jgi:hypothetical protein